MGRDALQQEASSHWVSQSLGMLQSAAVHLRDNISTSVGHDLYQV